MGYLFGIVLCFTFLAVLRYWERTKPEREKAAVEQAKTRAERAKVEAEQEVAMRELRLQMDRDCSKNLHRFGKWKDSPGGTYQIRVCMNCGLRDHR